MGIETLLGVSFWIFLSLVVFFLVTSGMSSYYKDGLWELLFNLSFTALCVFVLIDIVIFTFIVQ